MPNHDRTRRQSDSGKVAKKQPRESAPKQTSASKSTTESQQPSALNLPLTGEVVRRTVLRALFDDEDALLKLSQALHGFSGASAQIKKVNAILTPLNTSNQPPTDPGFTKTQCNGLAALLREKNYEAISPFQSGPDRIERESRGFWTRLLSLEPGDLREFHQKVADYSADPSNPNKRQAVLDLLQKNWNLDQWGDDHLKALAQINAQDSKFRSLSWYDVGPSFW